MSIAGSQLARRAALFLVAAACAHRERVAPAGDRAEIERHTPASSPGGLPLATTPEQLLAPGAIERIQEALQRRGLLEPAARRGHLDVATAGAIRRFQVKEDIARTGVPDHETVRRLGLDPDALFRKAPTTAGANR